MHGPQNKYVDIVRVEGLEKKGSFAGDVST
jgi:hypothetical protein